MCIDPHANGQDVIMRCDKHIVFAPIPTGLTFEELMSGDVDWFNPASPLERMEAAGNGD
jgi:hypothetical protein